MSDEVGHILAIIKVEGVDPKMEDALDITVDMIDWHNMNVLGRRMTVVSAEWKD